MDAFEKIIGQLLEEDKYWVRHSVKVNLDKNEKKKIGKATTPRPEIDIVAYDAVADMLYLLEVKSFIDSKGVVYEQVAIQQTQQLGPYKLLTAKSYRDTITNRLLKDWKRDKIIRPSTTVNFGLIAGKVHSNKKNPHREKDLETYFNQKGWFFWGPTSIKQKLTNLSVKGYENNVITITAKILTR
jgi:hypothetical protein